MAQNTGILFGEMPAAATDTAGIVGLMYMKSGDNNLKLASKDMIRLFLGAPMKNHFSGTATLLQTEFVVTHNLGFTPSYVFIVPTGNVVLPGWTVPVSSKNGTTFTAKFATGLALGATVSFDWFAYK